MEPLKLFGGDARMLSCRVASDPRRGSGCAKVRFPVVGRGALFLCPKRVAVFLSAEGGSLAGVSCEQLSIFDLLERDDV